MHARKKTLYLSYNMLLFFLPDLLNDSQMIRSTIHFFLLRNKSKYKIQVCFTWQISHIL